MYTGVKAQWVNIDYPIYYTYKVATGFQPLDEGAVGRSEGAITP